MTKSSSVTGTVSKSYKAPGSAPADDSVSEILAVHKFETTPAVVGLEQGMTVNLGKYESAKITVSISIPCYKEEIDAAYAQAQEFVEKRLGEEIKDLKNLSASRTLGGI